MPGLHIYQLNESAVTIEFGNEISESLLHTITTYNNLLYQKPFDGFITAIPAYSTLTVFFDYLKVFNSSLPGGRCLGKVSRYLSGLAEAVQEETTLVTNRIVEIPVCYDNDMGTDISEVSRHTGLSTDEIVKLHTANVYVVHMIGFIPGFAYLGGMDKQLAIPRKANVNAAVPAGAVGIAGEQTGIYPLKTPGGWQIIGRTPVSMFNINDQQPSLLKAGDMVKFKSISKQEFEQYSNAYPNS